MEIFQNRNYIIQFWSSGDGTGSRFENNLETIDMSSRKIEQKRVAAINLELLRKANDKKLCSGKIKREKIGNI